MTWAPNYLEVYRRRVKLINAARDPLKAASIRNHYRNDPIAFIGDFVTTYDPRNARMPYMPFVLFQKQIDFIRFLQSCLSDKQAGLVEKSRDVGASWLCCAFAVWPLLFHPGSSVGFGSRVVDDVDKIGKPDLVVPENTDHSERTARHFYCRRNRLTQDT